MNKTPTHFRVSPKLQTPLRWKCLQWTVFNPHPRRRTQGTGRKSEILKHTGTSLLIQSIAPPFDSHNPLAERLDLEFSTITDVIDPTVTITESLTCLFQHTSKNPCDYPDITQMCNMSDTVKDPTHPGIGEGTTTNTNTTTPLFSPPGTDLLMVRGMPVV